MNIFQRQELLLGREAQEKLAGSHVAVCGLGGVGSFLCEALVRSGVGELTLIDSDTVADSNINRQLYALQSTVGRFKTEVASKRIADINPNARLHLLRDYITPDNAAYLVRDCGFICDAIDYVPGKIALIEYAWHNQVPLISAMGAGRRLDPSRLRIADISSTGNCPLARSIRRQLRQRGINEGVTVCCSSETPVRQLESPDTIGSVAFVPSVMGLMMAGYVIRTITGISDQSVQ